MSKLLNSKRYEPQFINLENNNTSHSLIIELVGNNKNVLEIGTSTGYLSKILKDNGNSVTGIEIDQEAGKVAGKYCESMIIGDVETVNLDEYFHESSFDVIIFGDVLEHLKLPDHVLGKVKKYLKTDGYLVVSLPNVCHGDVLLNLIRGDFKYTPSGLLDLDHLRFFGYKNIVELFNRCGYGIVNVHTTIVTMGNTEQKFNQNDVPEDLFNFVNSLPYANVYQFVFTAVPGQMLDKGQMPEIPLEQIFDKTLRKTLKKHTITLENEILKLNASNQALKNEMKNSIAWQLLMAYNKGFVERALPRKTKRRHLYDLAIKSGRILVNEGWRSLWRQYWERKRVKKMVRAINANRSRAAARKYKLLKWKNEEIVFPAPSSPVSISIVIPVHNKFEYTYNCLRSILKYSTLSYEVIIVDDASNDTTGELLKKVKNIKVIRNESNLGFIGSCNEGMKVSDGKYVLFLNNDTLVTEYWLEPLVNVIDRKNVGAVGAKLIYPNGKLQEAGGIIWNDASGWNYGRGDDAEMPEYNFVREVDYCSGAALMVKKELFDKLGGFNSIFKPAYYEDTDLCFALRGIKYKVMYQPQSVVVHFEGASNGIDTSSSVKRYQEVNKTKFEEKWHNVLLIDQYPPDSTNLFLARNKKKGMNILVIDHYIPTYDKDSGSLRMYNMLKILSELGHKVTFIGNNLTKLEPYTSVLQQNGVEVIYDPYCRSIDEYLAINGRFFNIAILSRAHVADKYILSVKKYCTNAKIIFDTVDLQFLREERRAKVENEKIFLDEAKRLKEIEFRLMEMSDVTLVVSPVEKEIINNGNPQIWVEIISNILEVKGANTPFSDRKDIMFVGNFIHPPNADAVKWFVKEIFPLVKEKLPGVKFYITGDNPTGEIMALASQDVVVTGFVKDLTIYFEKCRVFVAPLRYGAGVKGKINQSMSYGLPVISTTIGIEGMQLKDGVDILVADTPGEFADNIVRLYLDEELWNKISPNSIINVQNNFSYDTGKQKIKELINHLTTNDATIIIKNDSAIH